MSLKTQAKLVRVIEEGQFEPIGSSDPVSVDTRILAASSKNLKELIAKGRFREDLFFKLNVIPLNIPPLRERAEDIPILIEYFLEHFSAEYGKKRKSMDAQAEKAFLNYSWPGNVSELMNVIERFAIMVPDDEINAAHLSLLVETRETENLSGIAEAGPSTGPGTVRAEVHPQGPQPERLEPRRSRGRAQARGIRPPGQDQGPKHHPHGVTAAPAAGTMTPGVRPMPIDQCEAIVLRTYNFADQDKIAVLFSRDKGVLRGRGQGRPEIRQPVRQQPRAHVRRPGHLLRKGAKGSRHHQQLRSPRVLFRNPEGPRSRSP